MIPPEEIYRGSHYGNANFIKNSINRHPISIMDILLDLCAVTSPASLENLMSVADITTCHVKALVDFCKSLPGFTDLPNQDQITLIKNSTIDASLLRSAYSYAQHPERQMKQTTRVTSLLPDSDLFQPVRRFYDRIADINPTETQIGLLVALR